MEQTYIILDHISRFFVEDQELCIACGSEEDIVRVCVCEDKEKMEKKVSYLKGLIDTYYASKVSEKLDFAAQYVVSVEALVKKGEPVT